MLFFLYFFIGHLIGDFLFQTSNIVRWKQGSHWGITFHVALVFIATLLAFAPYLNSVAIWVALLVNAALHWGVDYAKVNYDKDHKGCNPLPAFFADQLAHVAAFSLIVLFIPKTIEPRFFTDAWWFEYYSQTNLLLYITGFLFFSYTLDIIYFMFQLKRGDFKPYERSYYSMIVHTFLFAMSFTFFWFLGRFYFNIF